MVLNGELSNQVLKINASKYRNYEIAIYNIHFIKNDWNGVLQ